MLTVAMDGHSLGLDPLMDIARRGARVVIADSAKPRIEGSRQVVDAALRQGRAVYGVTTGFGKFSDTVIGRTQAETLQRNLILSHATGVGDYLSEDVVRAALALRINALCKGYSGIRLTTLETLAEMLNRGVVPAIPEKGSLGASGDLAPLSHLCSVLIGSGEAWYEGRLLPGMKAMESAGLSP